MKTLFKTPLLALGLTLAAITPSLQAAPVSITNFGFESNADNTTPIGWQPAVGSPSVYNWAGINSGMPAAEGTNALLAATGAFSAISQTTGEAVNANETFTLTAAFGDRVVTPYGGHWLRLVLTNGAQAYVVANQYSFAGEPGSGLFLDKSLTWTAPSDLSMVPVIQNGITGTSPSGPTVDLSSGSYFVDILVGANFPSGINDANVQTGIDNVRLDAVPEPSTYALMGLSALGFVIFRRRKLVA